MYSIHILKQIFSSPAKTRDLALPRPSTSRRLKFLSSTLSTTLSTTSAAMSPKVVFGMMGSSVASGSAKMATPQQVQAVLDVLKRHRVTEIDTARIYNDGRSEELLGLCKTSSQGFSVQTKAPGFSPGSLKYEAIIKACNASLKALDVEKVDIYYFHGPDRATDLEESLRAANELYAQGKYERLGIYILPPSSSHERRV